MEEILKVGDKIITNYLSFQSALNDLEMIFREFMYVYENDDEVKFIQNLTYTMKPASNYSHHSIEKEINELLHGNSKMKRWTKNRFLKHLLRCYIRSENELHPETHREIPKIKPALPKLPD
ncbi:hypothetical protein RF11_00448 [Thelohanellus kitauei]|uniref:Uncharacterized protein n=1 Tax=Thelohanellus kitauei TaxID=669202 RepID=A0A0C2JD35_THEKT|nr:hypothetical protein RF11_00448 [Thelohanellus kitauei]